MVEGTGWLITGKVLKKVLVVVDEVVTVNGTELTAATLTVER